MLFLSANHVSYYVSYLGMNYNNVIGFLLFFTFLVQFGSGLLLSCYYSDCYSIAFDSVIYITTDVNLGWLFRLLHVLAASLFMLFIFAHLGRGAWIKLKAAYEDSVVNIIWVSGLFLLGLSLAEGFLGYILLWGQMSYWGITVILNALSIMPYFGPALISLIWCSSQIIAYRVFIFHFFIGCAIGLLTLFHILIMHSLSNSNPLASGSSSIIIPFYPLIYKDLFVLFSLELNVLFLCFYLQPEMLGNSDNLILSNPLLTPKNILPEWYYLCFYCCLRCFPDKAIGFVVVTLFLSLAV